MTHFEDDKQDPFGVPGGTEAEQVDDEHLDIDLDDFDDGAPIPDHLQEMLAKQEGGISMTSEVPAQTSQPIDPRQERLRATIEGFGGPSLPRPAILDQKTSAQIAEEAAQVLSRASKMGAPTLPASAGEPQSQALNTPPVEEAKSGSSTIEPSAAPTSRHSANRHHSYEVALSMLEKPVPLPDLGSPMTLLSLGPMPSQPQATQRSSRYSPPKIRKPPPKNKTTAALPEKLVREACDSVLMGGDDHGGFQMRVGFKENILDGLGMRIESENGKIVAVFTTDNVNVRRLLEGKLASLQNRLESKGLTVSDLRVEML